MNKSDRVTPLTATQRSKLVAASEIQPRREVPLFAAAIVMGVVMGFALGYVVGLVTA